MVLEKRWNFVCEYFQDFMHNLLAQKLKDKKLLYTFFLQIKNLNNHPENL